MQLCNHDLSLCVVTAQHCSISYSCFVKEVTEETKNIHVMYHISLVVRWIIFFPKQSQSSRSVLKDGSRSLELFRKGKIGIIIAKFHRTDLVIPSHSRGTKNLTYSQINTVVTFAQRFM